MLAFVMVSMMVAANDPAPQQATLQKTEATRYCREMGSAASRSQAVMVCRTRTQWERRDACVGATRYCAPVVRTASATLGRETAFPLNEDSRIICRRLRATGTRLTSQRTCLPQREWDRMWKDSAEATQRMQEQSTRVPREQ